MSYSIIQARQERATEVWQALKEDDVENLYRLAAQFKEEGEHEQAGSLRAIARRIESEEWAYDEANGN